MTFKVLTGILAVLVLAEGGYIFLTRHPISRFKPVDVDGYVAFDSATGQLCKTFRPAPNRQKMQPAPIKLAPSSLDSKESSSKVDTILSAIQGGLTKAEFEKKVQEEKNADAEAQAEFIRSLPACVDIH